MESVGSDCNAIAQAVSSIRVAEKRPCDSSRIDDGGGSIARKRPRGKLWRYDSCIRAMLLDGHGYSFIAARLLSDYGLQITVRALRVYGRKLIHGDLFDDLRQQRASQHVSSSCA